MDFTPGKLYRTKKALVFTEANEIKRSHIDYEVTIGTVLMFVRSQEDKSRLGREDVFLLGEKCVVSRYGIVDDFLFDYYEEVK